jgi:hypothetical protein
MELWPQITYQHHDDAVTNTAVELKGSSGLVVGGDVFNPHASNVGYLVFFAVAAASVVLGTTVPVFSVAVPPGSSRKIDPPRPIRCNGPISYAAATTRLGAIAPSTALSMCACYF